MSISIPRIELSPRLKKVLAKRYGVTDQHVRNSLKYYSNSPKSQLIRQDAIQLLKKEAAKAAVKINS